MRKTRMQKGITLIALIITIIILLILAVVTIGSIKNSNIITYAQNASTDYEKAKNDEEGILSNYESIIKENLPGENGNSEIGKATVGTKAIKNSTIDGKAYSSTNPIIPAGYAPINITGENDSKWDDKEGPQVNKGLVITDNTTTRDENGNTVGNEFVWVPVDNINTMVMCQNCVATADGIDEETLQCTKCGENTKLAGKLYATTIGENSFNASLTGQRYTEGSGLREPDVLTELYNPETKEYEDVSTSDIDTIYLVEKAGMPSGSTSDDFKIQLQKEFNEMVASVAKYKGFYVGRYETSLTEDKSKVQSIAGVAPATSASSSADTWYGLYAKSKTYSQNGVVSGMIWGCQYDAVMRFIEDRANATGNVAHGSSEFTTVPYLTGGTDYSTNYKKTEGEKGYLPYADIVNNIYDLEGNVIEWTQEAYSTIIRVYRGGGCSFNHSPGYRGNGYPSDTGSSLGSRLALYIV